MDPTAAHTAASTKASTSHDPRPPVAHPRSHRRKDGQPPRPPNAWICYRAARSQELRAQPEYARIAQSEISKVVARLWKEEDPAVRRQYELEAQELKRAHREKYPDYTYSRKVRDPNKAPSLRARQAAAAAHKSEAPEQERPAPRPAAFQAYAVPVSSPLHLPRPPQAPPSSAPAASFLQHPNAISYQVPLYPTHDQNPAAQRSEAYTPAQNAWASMPSNYAMTAPMSPPWHQAPAPASAPHPLLPPLHAPPPVNYPLPTRQRDPNAARMHYHYGNEALPGYPPAQPMSYTTYRAQLQPPAPEQLWRHGADDGNA
ncbi:hypothetical protein JCM3774_004311 [Rhodotorula dairenensis]